MRKKYIAGEFNAEVGVKVEVYIKVRCQQGEKLIWRKTVSNKAENTIIR